MDYHKLLKVLIIAFLVLFAAKVIYDYFIKEDLSLAPPQLTCQCPHSGYYDTGIISHLRGDKNTIVTRVIVNDCAGTTMCGNKFCNVEYARYMVESAEPYWVEGYTTDVPCI